MDNSAIDPQNLNPNFKATPDVSTSTDPLPKYRPEIEFQIAKLWQKKGKFDRAIAGYKKILEIAPTHWQSLEAIGDLLIAQGNETTAVSLYHRAIQHLAIDGRLQQALIYQQSGKLELAIEEYQKVLEIQPNHPEAFQGLEKVLLQNGDFSTAIAVYQKAITHNPNDAELHKRLINVMIAEYGFSAAFDHYRLVREDTKDIEISVSALLCCVVVRNEHPRLPYFLSYYRQKGVDRFLFIDNQSTDDTLAYLLQQPDVYVWSSTKSFNQVNFGSVWFELLLRRHGINHWCLTVDADELLYYPDCEHKTIPQLCQELDEKQYRAYTAILLDMYADKAIQETHCTPGQDFLKTCPYFDRQYYHRKQSQGGPYRNQTIYFGGLRERIFGVTGDYILNKVPLLKYGPDVVLAGGQHFTNLPETKIAQESGCLLHFKYFSLFPNYVAQEVQRQEHYGGAHQYLEYSRTLSSSNSLNLYDLDYSVPLQNSQQLIELGILQVEPTEKPRTVLCFPTILPLPPRTRKPVWSVMITAYNRVNYLEHALRSVLDQAPDTEQMQIEVVNDGAPAAIAAEIASLVEHVGQGRVNFYRHPENIGHPHIFNLCIQRASGQWVHLLHDDDWVEPGFYAALQSGIEQNLEIGAAFCRCKIVNEAGQEHWISNLERSTPGILSNWLERIAAHCELQFPAIVVKRDVYETIGGFCAEANSAFDWEMWQRIAVHYSVWYEPQPLAYFRTHTEAESHQLMKSGQQIADSRKAIEIAQTYLPKMTSDSLSDRARERYALWALQLAKQQLKQGMSQAAIANIGEALQCSQSSVVQQALTQLFLEIKV
jgi:tetratricopeptide (TPR) repeat protein